MNERIRELADEATSIVEMVGPQGYTSSYAKFDREKFAELIVRECAGRVDWILAEGGGTQGDLIREHFGVES